MQTRGLFITGSDTGVGKTCVASLIARESRAAGLRVGAYKPVCSGADRSSGGELVWGDVEELSRAIGHAGPRERICPQQFAAPVAPATAARLEGRTLDSRLLRDGALWWDGRCELMVVEGAGGLLCPLGDGETIADLAGELGCPLVIVVRLRLGCINHTLLTVEVAKARRLAVAGLVLNEVDPSGDDACARREQEEISERCGAPILGLIEHNRPDRLLHNAAPARINWLELATKQISDF